MINTGMLSTNEETTKSNIEVTSFVFKGSLYALTSLQLQNTQLENLDQHLKLKIQQAPKFFSRSPIVIDLSKLPEDYVPDFKKIIACLNRNDLIPIGVRKSPNPLVNEAAVEHDLAILAENKDDLNKSKTDKTPEIKEPACKIITTPVRSGQQVYARGGDLVVLAPVSHGAEILADGNIHVYGPLRGRALAGVMNNSDAHIFCHCLEAELVSIAGTYQVSENMRESKWKQAVHIYLSDGNLKIDKM